MGSHCAKLSTGGGQGHKSTMKKLVACVSQDSFSLSTEGEEQEQGEEEEGEEELPVQGKLLLMEPEQQEEGAERKTLWPRRDPSPGRCTPDMRPAITAQEEGRNTAEKALHGLFLCWSHPHEKHNHEQNARMRKSNFLKEHVTTAISMQY